MQVSWRTCQRKLHKLNKLLLKIKCTRSTKRTSSNYYDLLFLMFPTFINFLFFLSAQLQHSVCLNLYSKSSFFHSLCIQKKKKELICSVLHAEMHKSWDFIKKKYVLAQAFYHGFTLWCKIISLYTSYVLYCEIILAKQIMWHIMLRSPHTIFKNIFSNTQHDFSSKEDHHTETFLNDIRPNYTTK